jgi:hypothetical protein
MVGFEPTLSSTPSWRIAKLSHILNQSGKWELNPPFHVGNVADCQYPIAASFRRQHPTQKVRKTCAK